MHLKLGEKSISLWETITTHNFHSMILPSVKKIFSPIHAHNYEDESIKMIYLSVF